MTNRIIKLIVVTTLFLLPLLALLAAPRLGVLAAALTVTNVQDITSGGCGGCAVLERDAPPGGDGQTWGTAYNDLQDALAAASSGSENWVADGLYKPATSINRNASFWIPASDVGIYGGFAGVETAATNVTGKPTSPSSAETWAAMTAPISTASYWIGRTLSPAATTFTTSSRPMG